MIASILYFLTQGNIFAQFFRLEDPFSHAVSAEGIWEVAPGNKTAKLLLQISLEEGKHLYSVNLPKGSYPIPTRLEYHIDFLSPIQGPEESKTIRMYDEAVGKVVQVHKQRFQIWQAFRFNLKKAPGNYAIPVKMHYQVCDRKICSMPRKIFIETLLTIK